MVSGTGWIHGRRRPFCFEYQHVWVCEQCQPGELHHIWQGQHQQQPSVASCQQLCGCGQGPGDWDVLQVVESCLPHAVGETVVKLLQLRKLDLHRLVGHWAAGCAQHSLYGCLHRPAQMEPRLVWLAGRGPPVSARPLRRGGVCREILRRGQLQRDRQRQLWPAGVLPVPFHGLSRRRLWGDWSPCQHQCGHIRSEHSVGPEHSSVLRADGWACQEQCWRTIPYPPRHHSGPILLCLRLVQPRECCFERVHLRGSVFIWTV